MSDMNVIYSVVLFGCNSSPSDMWCPQTKLFTNYEEAYAYFLSKSPDLDHQYILAEQQIFREPNSEQEGPIEERKQLPEYAKRPEGAVISKHFLRLAK